MPNLLGLIRQGNNNGSLEDIGQLIQLVNQQNQNKGIPTENIGGYNIPINRGRQSGFGTGLNALSSLAGGYQMTQQIQRRNQFLQGVQQIVQEQSNPDDKINKLMGLMAQHGSDYGLGLKEIITQYGQQANRSALTSRFTQNEGGQFQVPEGFEITGYDQKGQPMVRRKQPTPQERETAKAEGQVMAQTLKQKKQAETDFLVAKNKLRTTMSAFKAMTESAGGAGRIKGYIGSELAGRIGVNPYTQAYKGQLVEAAAALAKLAAPSARVGQEIIDMFKQTLPSVVSTAPEAINQIRFSLQNAFATVLGRTGQEYTPEIDDMITQMVTDIVDVKPMRTEDLKRFKPGQAQSSDYQKYLQSIGGE